jgi:hypothetical protein
MLEVNHQAEQLSLFSPAELAELEVEAGLYPTWMEEETASRARLNVRKPPPPEANMVQDTLPGIVWPK